MTTPTLLTSAKQTAIISFLIGTIIFSFYFLTSSFGLLFLGYGFILVAGLFNIGLLTALLLRAYKEKDHRVKIILRMGFMLLNIPVMLVYCWFAIILLNTMRIKFINATGKEITDINIVGCESIHLNKLEPNESQTVWISITGDCSIDIEYLSNGQKKTETVFGYCTNDMGQKATFRIGKDKSFEQNL